MTDMLTPAQAAPLLDTFFDRHLPISHYLNMRCHAFSGDRFSLAIDLKPSLNDKLTAFGGSLYCLCVMNCWGMIYLQCRQRGIDPNLVVTHGEIDYLAPVDDDVIVATCQQPDDMGWDDFIARVMRRGKAKVRIRSTVQSQGHDAVQFFGRYAVIGLAG